MKRYIRWTISILIVIGVLYYSNWEEIFSSLKKISPKTLFIAFFLCFLQFPVLGLRWYLLTKNISPVSVLQTLKDYFYAIFLNSFTPANLAGDVYRFLTLKKYADSKLHCLSFFIVERILGLLSFFIVYIFFSFSFLSEKIFFIFFIISSTAVIVFFLLYFFAGKKISFIQFYSTGKLFSLLILSFLSLFLWVTAVYSVSRGLSLDIPLSLLIPVIIIVEILRLIPVTVQGIGLREGSFAYLLHLYGYSFEQAFVVSAISYVILSLSMLFSGLLSAVIGIFFRHEE